MKKGIFALTIITLLCVAPISAYANPLTEPPIQEETIDDIQTDVEINITGGIESKSTFDESRTISGSAEQGTKIAISVSSKDASGSLTENACYNMKVGVSGLFSQMIDLELGENIVTITAEKDGCNTVNEEVTIKRKRREIKNELENGVSIPGNNTFTTKSPLFTK